jgi:hypothetical protein
LRNDQQHLVHEGRIGCNRIVSVDFCSAESRTMMRSALAAALSQ